MTNGTESVLCLPEYEDHLFIYAPFLKHTFFVFDL